MWNIGNKVLDDLGTRTMFNKLNNIINLLIVLLKKCSYKYIIGFLICFTSKYFISYNTTFFIMEAKDIIRFGDLGFPYFIDSMNGVI